MNIENLDFIDTMPRNFILDNCFVKKLDSYLHVFRSAIPSSEQMLIKNLPELKNRNISLRIIEEIDLKEMTILNTPEEKEIDRLKRMRSISHVSA